MEEYKLPEQENGGALTENGFWSKVKGFLFKEIVVELTPAQQMAEDRLNEVLHQEITFGSLHDFLFQEIKF